MSNSDNTLAGDKCYGTKKWSLVWVVISRGDIKGRIEYLKWWIENSTENVHCDQGEGVDI